MPQVDRDDDFNCLMNLKDSANFVTRLGWTLSQACNLTGADEALVARYLKEQNRKQREIPYCPSPDEIAAACKEIQAGWRDFAPSDDDEKRQRAVRPFCRQPRNTDADDDDDDRPRRTACRIA